MHRNGIGAGLDEGGDIALGVLNHEVDVQVQARDLADGFDHRRPNGDIGDEVAVHDVHVQDGGAGALDASDLFGQAGKVRRQD